MSPPGTGAPAALEVRDLRVDYVSRGGTARALWDVGFHVRRGECYGLVGESGCGKTTVAMSIVRHLPPAGEIEGGAIYLNGVDVLAIEKSRLRDYWGQKVATVYQDPATALNPSLSVGRQVAEVYRYSEGLSAKAAAAAAREMLATVLLTPPRLFAERFPHQLSGGQQQRIVIAMALAARPELLILDEPTTNLDATVEAEVLSLIMDLRHDFVDAVLFITHNLGLVRKMCDRVGVLYAGRIVEDGSVAEVLNEPAHPYTRALLSCVPRLTADGQMASVSAIPGYLPRIGEAVAGCSFEPRCRIARPECAEVKPQLEALREGRRVRCFFPFEAVPDDAEHVRAVTAVGDTLLEVRSLTKRFGSVEACSEVSLKVRRGEVLGLVGESGSGKSTLGRCIVGLSAPDDGTVVFRGSVLGRTLARRSRDDVKELQMILQSPDSTLNPRHRVRRILRRALRRLGSTVSPEQLAETVRLDSHHLDQRASELSGGLRQRVGIARAFASQPACVVCDEPVSSLDVSVQAAILDLLLNLQAGRGTAYLFISHDLGVVRYLSHRIAVMYRGQIVELGGAAVVFKAPHHPYTELLLSAISSLDGPATRRPQDGPVGEDLQGGGCRFRDRCPYRIEELCESEVPPVHETADGHQIRCHHLPANLAVLQGHGARQPEGRAQPVVLGRPRS
jgi:peptide/nickel transport system ATP-binding protein